MKQVLLSLAFALPSLAFAYAPEGLGGGLFTGFSHPILAFDHLIAMVAVGLWGAFLGSRALWILRIVFPCVTAVGAAIGCATRLPRRELTVRGCGGVISVVGLTYLGG